MGSEGSRSLFAFRYSLFARSTTQLKIAYLLRVHGTVVVVLVALDVLLGNLSAYAGVELTEKLLRKKGGP